MHIETKTYENGNEADRLKVLNTLSDVRFSKQLDTDTSSAITQADVEQLRSIGRKSIFKFTSEDIRKSEKWAKKFYSELGTKSPFFRAWFGDWRENDTGTYKVIADKSSERGTTKNNDTGWDIIVSKKVSKETEHQSSAAVKNAVKYLPYINDITQNSILLSSEISNKDNSLSLMFHSMYSYTEAMGYPALLKLKVEELADEKSGQSVRRDYILQSIEEEPISESKRLSKAHQSNTGSSTVSISDLYALVKSYDKDFKSQPSSKVVNEDGTPKVVYHGTNADFWTFSLANRGKNGEKLGVGYYFVDNKSSAERYGDRVIEAYLDIKKPASAEVMEISRKDWEKFLDFAIEHRDEYIDGEWKSKSRFSDSQSRSSEENSVRYARRIDSSGKRTAYKVRCI